jgi:hypothetical protein
MPDSTGLGRGTAPSRSPPVSPTEGLADTYSVGDLTLPFSDMQDEAPEQRVEGPEDEDAEGAADREAANLRESLDSIKGVMEQMDQRTANPLFMA